LWVAPASCATAGKLARSGERLCTLIIEVAEAIQLRRFGSRLVISDCGDWASLPPLLSVYFAAGFAIHPLHLRCARGSLSCESNPWSPNRAPRFVK
jgi:hypothetical protein